MKELLRQILAELQKQNSSSALGFCSPPKTRCIYANRQYPDCLWYFWNGAQNKHEPISLTAIECYVQGVQIKEGEYRGKPDHKFQVLIQADSKYIVEVGLETIASKALIQSLLNVPSFSKPVTIAVEPGDTDQVLFTRIYQDDAPIKYEWSELDWVAAVDRIAARLNKPPESKPEAPQPEPMGLSPITLTPPTKAIDEFTAALQNARSLTDCMAAWNRLMRRADEWMDLDGAYGFVVKNYSKACSTYQPQLAEAIGSEVQRVGWTRKQASDFLQAKYGKATRAELTLSESIEFLIHMQNLKTATHA